MARAAAVALGVASAGQAEAHALGDRYELPAPVWLFIVAGALTVVVTFAIVAAFGRAGAERYAQAERGLSHGALGRMLAHPFVRIAPSALGIAVLAFILLAGAFGARDPARNLAPTLVWIVWWVGFSYVAMLVGNVWPLINPWAALHRWALGTRIIDRGEGDGPSPWTAVVLLLAFGWLELVFPFKANPRWLAGLVLLYSAVTWIGMTRWGRAAWLVRADPFHRCFELLGRFAPFGVAPGGGVALRPYAAGLMRADRGALGAADVAFIVAMLAIVLFDGLLGSSHWVAIEDAIHALNPKLGDLGWIAVHSVGLIVTWLLFLGAYLLAVGLAHALTGAGGSTAAIAAAFGLTLMPIAVGYHFAHTFTYLLVQGQGAIALASDPLGWGWNLFGTRDRQIDIAIIQARTAWYLAFAAIVVGHAVSVYLAHIAAERLFEGRSRVLRALLPITLLMILYTAISLQILAEPLVRYTGPQETII